MGLKAWKCPKCGIGYQYHTKVMKRKTCKEPRMKDLLCDGLTCCCREEHGYYHGQSERDPCSNARCCHCGWRGRMPYRGKQDDSSAIPSSHELTKVVDEVEHLIAVAKLNERDMNRHLGYHDGYQIGRTAVQIAWADLKVLVEAAKNSMDWAAKCLAAEETV